MSMACWIFRRWLQCQDDLAVLNWCFLLARFGIHAVLLKQTQGGYEPSLSRISAESLRNPFCFHSLLRTISAKFHPLTSSSFPSMALNTSILPWVGESNRPHHSTGNPSARGGGCVSPRASPQVACLPRGSAHRAPSCWHHLGVGVRLF